jgi:glycosyltransferase involved in cell wall biosynthesis
MEVNHLLSDDSMDGCSIVIRCFNEEEHIGRLLSGIMQQTIKDVEIILVDSGSTDATVSIASRYPVKIVPIKPEEFSFGRSLNLGCAEASRDFIVIASAHVYPVYKDWLENLLSPFKDPDVAIVYGKQRGDKFARYTEHQIYRKWFPEESAGRQAHPFCNNANAAIRRTTWRHLPYNEELTGLEDLDWANRVVDLGKKIVYCAEAEIIHVHNETLLNIYNRYKREAIAFKKIYPQEHFNFMDFVKLLMANILTDYYHALKDRVFMKCILSIPEFRFMQFWGTYRGFGQRGDIPQMLRNRFYYPNSLSQNTYAKTGGDSARRIHYEHH